MHIYSRGGGSSSSHQIRHATAANPAPTHPPYVNPVAAESSTSPNDALLTLPVIYRKK